MEKQKRTGRRIALLASCIISLATISMNAFAVETTATNTDDKEQVFTVVEQMPMFPGGDAEMMKYLATSIKYPEIAVKNNEQGRVVVGFVVECDGSITDVNILRGVSPSLDKEAMRVVKEMPKWTPGKKDGSVVRVKYQVPIAFKMQ